MFYSCLSLQPLLTDTRPQLWRIHQDSKKWRPGSASFRQLRGVDWSFFLFWGKEQRKTTPLQLMNAFGDREITTDIERQITCFHCARVWMKNRCLSSPSFIIVCGHNNMAAKQSTLLNSLLSAKAYSWHPSTTGYQSKCITMNILGVVLEFTGTWVGSKCNVLLC